MTNKEALDLIQHKLDLAVDDPLIMTDKEYEVFSLCAKALEKQSTLDKITADIQELRNCSCSCSDGIIDDVEDIIDKYRESEEKK